MKSNENKKNLFNVRNYDRFLKGFVNAQFPESKPNKTSNAISAR